MPRNLKNPRTRMMIAGFIIVIGAAYLYYRHKQRQAAEELAAEQDAQNADQPEYGASLQVPPGVVGPIGTSPATFVTPSYPAPPPAVNPPGADPCASHHCPHGSHPVKKQDGSCGCHSNPRADHHCPQGKHWNPHKRRCVRHRRNHHCGTGMHWSIEKHKCVHTGTGGGLPQRPTHGPPMHGHHTGQPQGTGHGGRWGN